VRRGAIVALSLAAAACTAIPPDPDADRAFDGIEIAPYGMHESCLRLATGDRLDWRFESRQPVDFNLHYREGPAVLMPVTLPASYGNAGIFPVLITQDYCAAWEAGPAGAIVSYRLRPLRGTR
jgi:hypothetical protein